MMAGLHRAPVWLAATAAAAAIACVAVPGAAQPAPRSVFEGTIVAIEPDPRGWSGVVEIYQRVTYDVDTVVSGSLPARRVDVHHLIDERSNPDLDRGGGPFLRKDLFFVGNRVRVTVEQVTSPFAPVSGQTIYRAVPPTRPALAPAPSGRRWIWLAVAVVILAAVALLIARARRRP